MGTPPGVLTLSSTPQAAALARAHVRNLGSSWPVPVMDAVLLAVTVVVTNAVRYGDGGDGGSSGDYRHLPEGLGGQAAGS
jgi:hypothetical protein